MSKDIIKETPLGGWKGSAILAAFCFLFGIQEAFLGNASASIGFFVAACGWTGWFIQEKQHLEGKVIVKNFAKKEES